MSAGPRKFGISKRDFRDLEVKIPRRDPTAENLGAPTYNSIEEAENRIPWLRRRRRARGQ